MPDWIKPDWIRDAVLLALGALGTAIWFFWRRKAEQTPVFENIQKAEKLLTLRKELDNTNYTIADLKNLEDILMGRAVVAKELSASYEQRAEEVRSIEFSKPMTQREMNVVAAHAYESAERSLETTICQLKEYLSPEEAARLDDANAAWRDYIQKHAHFAAAQHEGGSIQPLILASALESVTVARIVELEVELKQFRETRVPNCER